MCDGCALCSAVAGTPESEGSCDDCASTVSIKKGSRSSQRGWACEELVGAATPELVLSATPALTLSKTAEQIANDATRSAFQLNTKMRGEQHRQPLALWGHFYLVCASPRVLPVTGFSDTAGKSSSWILLCSGVRYRRSSRLSLSNS
jgi:hypothetical protein